MRGPVVLAVLSCATATSAAVPAIDAIQVERSINDYVISWTPPSAPVDGYRVYRSREADCSAPEKVYEGAAPTYTETGAFEDARPALYRIAAFVGPEEGPLTTPAYKFSVADVNPVAIGQVAIALPPVTGVSNSLELCKWVNSTPVTEPLPLDPSVPFIASLHTATGNTISQYCKTANPTPLFSLSPGQAYMAEYRADRTPPVLWGHGHPTWTFDFEQTGTADGLSGKYWVSLPYDHGYTDLASLAADIPDAVEVSVHDDGVKDGDPGKKGDKNGFVGLSRASSTEPWSGSNFSLADRRGHGVRVAVEVAGSWSPQRICGRSLPPPVVNGLRLLKAGDDVHLEWAPVVEATGGYRVIGTGDRRRLLVPSGEAARLAVGEPSPSFPVVDASAVGTGASIFYQVAGTSAEGVLGWF